MSKSGKTILGLLAVTLLGGSIASSAVLGTNLKKSNNENEDLRQTNITISAENTNLKENLIDYTIRFEELKAQLENLSTTAVKNYALENQLTFSHFFNFQALTTAECEEITKAYYNLCKNNQPIYKGLVFSCINEEFPLPKYTNENGDIVEYYCGYYEGDMIAPEGKDMFLYMSSTSNFSNISLLEDFNYEVGKSYELFEKPVYLDSLDFECYEIDGNTFKFRNAWGTPPDLSSIDPGFDLDLAYHFIEITKEENTLTIAYKSIYDYDEEGNPIYQTITNVINLD